MKQIAICLLLVVTGLHWSYCSYSATLKHCRRVGLQRSNNEYPVFLKFVRKYHKEYKSPEDCMLHFEYFQTSLEEAKKLQETDKGTAKYGVTIMSDVNPEERESIPKYRSFNKNFAKIYRDVVRRIPRRWDWRKLGVVNRIFDQRVCSSGYAFATLASLETTFAIKYDHLYKLSEQQILDCSLWANGCHGGSVDSIAPYLIEHGAMRSFDYRYISKESLCKYNESKVVVTPLAYIRFGDDERLMAQFLYQYGPIIIGINGRCLIHYRGGILYNESCHVRRNHYVTLVGYGVASRRRRVGIPYWIGRNSWGRKWGENGYVRIIRNEGMLTMGNVATAFIID